MRGMYEENEVRKLSEEKITIEVESAEEMKQLYSPPIQSADTLFHFVKKIDYLIPIIEKFALVPRYCVEDIDYLDIGMKQIAYPMLCFCDINLHKMQEHMELYGGYGIAFSKKWGISKGIQPIQYVNSQSPLRNDFSMAFLDSLQSVTEDSAQNYLLSQMYYFKAIQGTMERNGEKIFKNFTDECEWRFIPDVKKECLPQAVSETEIFSISTLNNTLEMSDSCWLKFEAPDIKYIILKTDEEFMLVVDIIKNKGLDEITVAKLLSRIVVWPNVRGDF